MGNTWEQFFPSKDVKFTDKDLPDQTGKVHIVTGGYSGMGLVLATFLYRKNATVYIAGRNKDKFNTALGSFKNESPKSQGRIEFLKLDLADHSTIKASAEEFIKKETRLDVLVNNAGVMSPPAKSVDTLGHELMMSTNVMGPWLFTQYLLPILKSTAAKSPPGTVRITWASSYLDAAPKGGVEFSKETGEPTLLGAQQMIYAQTKAANALLASEFAQRYGNDGITSVAYFPGNLSTDLGRHLSKILAFLLKPILYEPRFGAYTMLYAGWSSDIDGKRKDSFIFPFGRLSTLPPGLLAATESKEQGGTGEAKQLWNYCEKECGKFL